MTATTSTVDTARGFSGRDWLVSNFAYMRPDAVASPLALDVADMLGSAFGGIYHVPDVFHKRTDWSNPERIEVVIHRSLSSFDHSDLSALLVGALDRHVRMEIQPHGPRGLLLIFSRYCTAFCTPPADAIDQVQRFRLPPVGGAV